MPYETLNKRFRAAQKNIDRETSHVTMVVAELEKTLSSCPAVDSVVSLLDGVVEKLSVLKRKVSGVLPCDCFVFTKLTAIVFCNAVCLDLFFKR